LSDSPGGASAGSARANAALKDALRKLPQMTMTFNVLSAMLSL
jgi:hypothetical protein